MRELGPVKEPEDEKSPKKKAPKAGFLASWMRRENSGEPDAKLNEQDLVDPEQDSLFNDGFSKRWHKVFSGAVPVDDPAVAAKSIDDQSANQPTTEDKEESVTPPAETEDQPAKDNSTMADEAREQVLKAAKSAQELKGEVEVQHDADHLSQKEITAAVPAKKSAKAESSTANKTQPEDFDVFPDTDDSQDKTALAAESDEKMNFEDMESTPATTGEPLPPLKDSADRAAINVFPAKEPFPRVDPSEFAHQTDIEDNVEAPGAPTKGYRGLLIVDHPDRAVPKITTPPPSLPPEAEAFLPAISSDNTSNSPFGIPDKSPSYILPSKDAAKWPNPANSRPVAGGRLKRNVQALIDRPASSEVSALVDQLSALNRLKQDRQDTSQPETSIFANQFDQTEDAVEIPATTPKDTAAPVASEGAVSVGSIIKDSPLAEKAKPFESNTTYEISKNNETPTEFAQASDQTPASPEVTPTTQELLLAETKSEPVVSTSTEVESNYRPAPAPLYNPPVAEQFPTQPSLQIPVLSRPDRYQLAMKRGILSGLAVSGVIMAAYLFG